MPLPFFLSCLALIALMTTAWKARRQAWGLPSCAVLGTVAVWYFVDVFYNDYGIYELVVGQESLLSAWWQVLLFLIAFGGLVKPISVRLNGPLGDRCSHAMAYMETDRLRHPVVQHRIDTLAGALLTAWLVLMAIALIQVKGNALGLFAPYLGYRANPWARGQIGGGFSAIISLAAYLQIFLTAAFGVIAAVAMNPRTQRIALAVCALALPYYIFHRTRNTMLVTMLPGILAFVFLRLRKGIWVKGGVLLAAFLVINFWFTFVMANRNDQSISRAFQEETDQKKLKETRHEGLNMFEELAWINHFIVSGKYLPNWGKRYFAEIVNPIPRGLWKNKPMIGLDYAVARGQAVTGAKGEVTATISTGMIGQGVVNFGRILGPIAAALLMCLWVALLVRQDLRGKDPARLILYGSGIISTINLGRDISLLGLYPFLFGLGLFWVWEYYRRRQAPPERRKRIEPYPRRPK